MSKKTVKSIEELLKEALVPEEEQPYEVPENWVWVRLNSVFEQITGQTQPTGDEIYIGLEHLLKGGGYSESGSSEELKSKKVAFKSGDVLYGKLRPYLNKHAYINFDGVASTDILVFRAKYDVLAKILNHYLGLTHVIRYANENSSGINLPRVSPKVMGRLPFPLPPTNEQKRIADKVERLLDKINQAKQLIEEAKETFELRRAAILDKAFRGELTKKWREEHPHVETAFSLVMREHKYRIEKNRDKKAEWLNYDIDKDIQSDGDIPNTWIRTPVGFLCDCIVPGRDKPKSFTGDIPWVTIPDLQSDSIADNLSGQYLTYEEIAEVNAKIIPINSVVMSCVGRFGISAVVEKSIVINQQLHAFLPSQMILPKYLMYHIKILKSYMERISTSTTISYLNKKNANSLIINLPPLEEQQVIIDIIDSLFENEEQALKLINDKTEFEAISEAILNKAFRGELGTNDPEEENLIEDVLRILH